MKFLAFLVAMVPTVVLAWLVGAFQWRSKRCAAIWVGMGLGALASVPIWFLETVIEDSGEQLSDLYQRAFVQQVLGAAFVEELMILFAFLLTFLLMRTTRVNTRNDIVAIAVAAAIGFTTIENGLAVIASQSPLWTAGSRLLSIIAGHASLQLVMGYFAAEMLLGNRHRWLWGILMLVVPIAIHGWGDFSEAIFQAVDADSDESKRYFSYWIFGLFAYVAAAVMVLFQLKTTEQSANEDSEPIGANEPNGE